MCFALGAGCRHLNFVGEHWLLFRFGFQRRLQVESDGKLAAFIGACLAKIDLFIADNGIEPPPATPREGCAARHAIGVFHIIEAEIDPVVKWFWYAIYESDDPAEIALYNECIAYAKTFEPCQKLSPETLLGLFRE